MTDADDSDDYDDVSSDASGQSSLLVRQTSAADSTTLTQPLTYLQLGARPTWGTESQRGDNLLSAVGLTTSTTQFFKDDYRSANGLGATGTTYSRDDGYAVATTTATALTSELMTRGGFRLHTDGNFVSTTRGDRVDVVGGNHKLVVLGRTNTTAYMESSGGHAVRDDASTHARFTSIEWNATRSTWTTYEETLKGNHTSRFQGPLETIFECDEISDTIGRAVDDAAATAPTIPATASAAHEQKDAATNWVNPSSGVGTGWPRAEESPRKTEHIHASSFEESRKVSSSLGAVSSGSAGTFSIARTVDTQRSRTRSATSTVRDVVHASKGAKVTEAIGFKSELVGKSDGADNKLHSNWRCRYYLGGYEGSVFATKYTSSSGGSTWLQETILDVVGIHITATTGVRLTAPNFGVVSNPAFAKGAFYSKEGWEGMAPLAEVLGSVFFGTSDTEIKVFVPTLEYSLSRASACLSMYKSRVNADHLHAHMVGAHVDMGFLQVVASLVQSVTTAVRGDTAALKVSMSGLHAKS